MPHTVIELTLDELKEYSQHDLVTSVFGKLDTNKESYLTLENQIIQDGQIFEPAISYEGKYLIAGNKRRAIALAHAAEFPDWRFAVRVFEGTPDEALTIAVTSNTVHTKYNKNELAILGARIYELRKDQFRQKVSFQKIAVQVGVGADIIQDAHKILTSGNEVCIYAITDQRPKTESVVSIARMMETLRDIPQAWGAAVVDKDLRKNLIAKAEAEFKQKHMVTQTRNEINGSVKDGEATMLYNVILIDNDVMPDTVPAATDGCAVLIWSTPLQLAERIAAMQLWDFTYRNAFVWTTKDTADILLYGDKGTALVATEMMPMVQSPSKSKTNRSVVFHDGITKMFPTLLKYDMYSVGKNDPYETAWFYGKVAGSNVDKPVRKKAAKVTK